MFLKALEMENFKSFRGEVVIPLDRGFSAITGPNGSGKSNCGDAIQFVLGPKSTRTIRAQNTKQLIFTNQHEGVQLHWFYEIRCCQTVDAVCRSKTLRSA